MGKSYVLAVAGGGGKTTLIGQLAENGRLGGKKTVVMTTTHMWLPNGYSAVGKTAEAAAEQMEQDGLVYYGAAEPGTGKMVFPGQEAYEYLCRRADLVLLEADGSKGLPMKVPDWSREPVIPCNTDGIIVVFGLSAVGKPAGEVCQRLELGRKWLEEDQGLEPGKRWLEENQGLEHLCVTEELAELFLENGYLKPLRFRFPNAHRILLLNQADSAWREAAGMRMKTRLEAKGWECRVEQLRRIKVSVIYMASGFGKRFGGNKLLELLSGKPLYRHGLDRFLEMRKGLEARTAGSRIQMDVILVSQYEEILRGGEEAGAAQTVENQYAAEGITASIRLGTEAADADTDYYLYSVADQPFLRTETLSGFLDAFLEESVEGGKSIGCLSSEGRRGNPVIFQRRYREELLSLKGDRGGSQIMKRYPEEVMEYQVDGKELEDIDSREGFQRVE